MKTTYKKYQHERRKACTTGTRTKY